MPSTISLTITESARIALLNFLRTCSSGSIATVVWSEGSWVDDPAADEIIQRQTTGPEWSVGAFNRGAVPPDEIVVISGIEFCLARSPHARELDGKTLDYRNGSYHLSAEI